MEHNHMSAELKPRGECLACDALHERRDEPITSSAKRVTHSGKDAAAAVEYLLSTGPGPFSHEMMGAAGNLFNASRSSVARLLGIKGRSEELFQKVKNEEMKIAHASREAGYIEYGLGREMPTNIIFGKGDRFWEAIGPISNYLKGWDSRGYEFTHLPPKEAAKRKAKIEQIISMLEKAKKDLEVRSDNSRLRLPSY